MKGLEILKNHWHIITTIFTAIIITAFVVGTYYVKIEYMAEKICDNSQKIETLEKNVYILVGAVQKENPAINLKAYVQFAMKHNLSNETTLKGFNILKKSTPEAGKLYLTQNYQFTNEQASMVFSPIFLNNNKKAGDN